MTTSPDPKLTSWGDVRWIGPALSRMTTADTFRVWRWTDDEMAQRLTDDLRDPPGITEPGLALTHDGAPVLALARNPSRDAADYRQWVLIREAGQWVPKWLLHEDRHGANLIADGVAIARWDRRTRGRVRDKDRFVVGDVVYRPAQIQPPGRWGWTLPLTGVTVADARGRLLTIGGRHQLNRDVHPPLPVDVRTGTSPGIELWALSLAVLASVWDSQAAAVAG